MTTAHEYKILVIHYSQSNQLTDIVASILAPFEADTHVQITHCAIAPDIQYPFPWPSAIDFCDVFAESFLQIPCAIAPLDVDPAVDYDLVIIAYPVWYLSPAIPVTAFFHSAQAQSIIAGRPVMTIIGCRNMWLTAQETVKHHIARLGGNLVGNMVLTDRAPNLVGVITIAHWMLTGKKGPFGAVFPAAGVSDQDIDAAARFGEIIRHAIAVNDLAGLQNKLNTTGATPVVAAYIVFEKRIAKVFNVWARFIRAKGPAGDPARRRRVKSFFIYLLAAIFLIAPLASMITAVMLRLKPQKIRHIVDAYHQNKPCG